MMSRRFVPVILLFAAALLLFTIGAASAALQTTNILRAWDDGLNRWENGNLGMLLNNIPEPFYTQMAWDAKPHADACGTGTSSPWAGDATIGLYHQDTGAPTPYDPLAPINGFVSSQGWKIVKCSTFTTAPNPINPPVFQPTDILTECVPGTPGGPTDAGCVIIGNVDVPIACSTGNCAWEIETSFHVNTDLNCDQVQDPQFANAGDLCMYWEGIKPSRDTRPLWTGNIQVRYGTGVGGDKTINFSVLTDTNAVTLSRVAATADAARVPLGAWAGGMFLAAAGLFVWRRNR